MKEGFDGAPIGLRITRRDAEILRHLRQTMFPGITVSISDVARVLMRAGMKQYGVDTAPGSDLEPVEPIVGGSHPKRQTRHG